MGLEIRWTSAFLDFDSASFAAGTAFWASVTGYDVSLPRGDAAEFATLLPTFGDDFLRVQRLVDGPSRVHLDLHVAQPATAAGLAEDLGATVVARPEHDYVVLRSPAGVTFCLVTHPAALRPPPQDWGGHRSLIDQVTLDVPADRHDAEVDFWAGLTGWVRRPSSSPTMAAFARGKDMPLRLMVQRVGDSRSPATAHLDLAADDRDAETARHIAIGARVEEVASLFTRLADPGGAAYCITDRDPDTGLLRSV